MPEGGGEVGWGREEVGVEEEGGRAEGRREGGTQPVIALRRHAYMV